MVGLEVSFGVLLRQHKSSYINLWLKRKTNDWRDVSMKLLQKNIWRGYVSKTKTIERWNEYQLLTAPPRQKMISH